MLKSEACVCLSYRIYRQSEDQKGIAMSLHKRLPVLTVPFCNIFVCHDGF